MGIVRKARIAYTGELIDCGDMDVRDLAPALLGFADLVDSVNDVLGGDKQIKVLLNQDSIQKGSFDITFFLDVGVLEQAKIIVGLAEETGIDALMNVLGWGITATVYGKGIFWLIKKIAGKNICGIEYNDNQAEIILATGEHVLTDKNTVKAFLDAKCRLNVEKVIQPLQKEGIESFQIRDAQDKNNTTPIEIITDKEKDYFIAPPAEEIKDEDGQPTEEQEIWVNIISINFKQGKWKFTDGTNTFWASVVDADYNDRIEKSQVSFRSGDMLKIRYYIKQSIKGGKLISEYFVTKIEEQKKAPTQIKLDFDYKE